MRHVQRGDTSYDNGYMYSQESDIEMHVSVTANRILFSRSHGTLSPPCAFRAYRPRYPSIAKNVSLPSDKTRSHHGRGTQPNANWSDASYTGGATSGAAPGSPGAHHGAPRH